MIIFCEIVFYKYVESVIHFGSSVAGKNFRDIDLCIFTVGTLSLKQKLALLRGLPEKYDVSFYDDLPLYVKNDVLVKGKILYTKNYYKLLKELQYVTDEFIRYKYFLEDYHEQRMAKV